MCCGDVGSLVTVVWFPEVAVHRLSLSVWGFVEETPFFPEAGAEAIERKTHDQQHITREGPIKPLS